MRLLVWIFGTVPIALMFILRLYCGIALKVLYLFICNIKQTEPFLGNEKTKNIILCVKISRLQTIR
jgi:hypothetical protein